MNQSGPVTAYAKLLGNSFIYYMTEPEVTLGRTCTEDHKDERPTVGLGSQKVLSRIHARISYNSDRARFEIICSSKNGLYVDGRFLSCYYLPVPLDSGSLIQIGPAIFYFLLPVRATRGTLEGVEIAYPKLTPEFLQWQESDLELITTAILRHGFDSWPKLKDVFKGKRSIDAIKYLSLKLLGSVINYIGARDTNTASKLAKIFRESMPSGVAATRPLPTLQNWKALQQNCVAWGRRIELLHQIRKAVQTYGETAVLDGVQQINGPLPASWWGRKHDVDLLRAIVRHGFGNSDAIIKDPELCFQKTNPNSISNNPKPNPNPTNPKPKPNPIRQQQSQSGNKTTIEWPTPASVGMRLREILRAVTLRNAKYNRKSLRRMGGFQTNTDSRNKKRSYSSDNSKGSFKRVKLEAGAS